MQEMETTSKYSHTEHLARVRALSNEFQTAISALEKRDIQRLEQSLINQERLCHEIAVIKTQSEPATDDRIKSAAEIRHAYMALAQKKRLYKELLKRSTRTTTMLGGLYRCYGAGLEKKSLNESHTLSCEV